MNDEQAEIGRTTSDAAKCQSRFATANLVIMLVFMIGNVLLPAIFFQAPDAVALTLGTFLSGVWATQAVMMGIYAAFANQFIMVRLAWGLIGLTTCVFTMLIGLQIAMYAFAHQGLEIDFAAFLAGIGYGSSFVVLIVGLVLRRFLTIRLADTADSRSTVNSSFTIAFLFRLMIAIALIMLVWKIAPTRFAPVSPGLLYIPFLEIVVITFVLVSALISAVLQASLAVHGRRKGLVVVLLLLVFGTSLDVILARIVLPNSYNFLFQLSCFFAFLSGFTVSLYLVGITWRWTGLRLVR